MPVLKVKCQIKNHCRMRTWGQQLLLSGLASPIPQTEVHYWIILRLRDRRKNCAVFTVENWAMVLGIWAAGLGVGLTMCGALHWVRSGQSADVFHVVPSLSLSQQVQVHQTDRHTQYPWFLTRDDNILWILRLNVFYVACTMIQNLIVRTLKHFWYTGSRVGYIIQRNKCQMLAHFSLQ